MFVRRQHTMPFGAVIQPDHGVLFHLWAPAQSQLHLVLNDGEQTRELPMESHADGWHTRCVSDAVAGQHYGYRLGNGLCVPDPASRYQPNDVHGLSEIIDPQTFSWEDTDWSGRPWPEAIIYELHVGTFSAGGHYLGIIDKLDELHALGVTAIELMPIAAFPGQRNWGYDGALLFAPEAEYGRPNELKTLVQAAHARGLMVFLDVVYNHFGPEGNYLHCYAPEFFHEDRHTPWGVAINFDGPHAHWVREFFLHNALYWLEEYHFDGLRLDAVDRIIDANVPDILDELTERVHQGPGQSRHIHLILENDHNDSRRYSRQKDQTPRFFTAQWNDDFHHALHVYLTGESDRHYQDFHDKPLTYLGRALAQGFAFQGEKSFYRGGQPRGTPSKALPPTAFVNFLQNHDQVGNRAFGERMHHLVKPESLRAAIAILFLAPPPPLLFMGEEFAAPNPFLFFCHLGHDFAPAVCAGRRNEFAALPAFADPARRATIPDPMNAATFEQSRLTWSAAQDPANAELRAYYQALIACRRARVVPLLPSLERAGQYTVLADTGLLIRWPSNNGRTLYLLTNLSGQAIPYPSNEATFPPHDPIWCQPTAVSRWQDQLPPWTVCCWTAQPGA